MDEKLNNQNQEITIPVKGPEEEAVADTEGLYPAAHRNGDSQENIDVTIDQLQRLQAEFSNYKKRIEKERKSLFSTAKGELVSKLLPVLDDFDRLLNSVKSNGKCDAQDVQYICQNLKECLVEEGMEEIESVGKPFDPHIHEAVDIEITDPDREGVVLEEWKKGYTFGEKLLRPSQVKVGKAVDDGRSDSE
ncbi:nucleotide exchange factor GrpE [bacterium]|nr:nucleotide exchange factor GrpE [bacterium]